MFDLTVMDLKKDLIDKINESGIPATVIVYVLKELLEIADKTLQVQLDEQKKEKQRVEEEAKAKESVETEQIGQA